jgi:hypothetical protein
LPIRGYKGWDTEEGVKWGYKEEGMQRKGGGEGRVVTVVRTKRKYAVCFVYLVFERQN